MIRNHVDIRKLRAMYEGSTYEPSDTELRAITEQAQGWYKWKN